MTENPEARTSMRPTLAIAFVLAALALAAPPGGSAATPADQSAIREVQARQADAWNRHDARAYAALFTPDGDVVNVVGWRWKGRAEIEGKLSAAFAFVFRDSVLTITGTDVRFPAPGLAVAHVRWTMRGARTPPGMPEPREGIQTQVLRKVAGRWLIEAFQNTLSVPEVPFPPGPPGVPSGASFPRGASYPRR
jgi:uncharacterized protein (TIGR02246 family)